jgi:hypothetical protein
MEHDQSSNLRAVAPLRRFRVRVFENDCHYDVFVTAHLVFNNKDRGEGLVFRRYYEDSVRTEKVAEFEPGTFTFYEEVDQ